MTDRELVTQSVERIKERIKENIDRNGQRASGKTQASLKIVPTDTGVKLISDRPVYVSPRTGRGPKDNGNVNFESIELGAQPGKRGGWFYECIYDWLKAKGVSVEMVGEYKRKVANPKSIEERSYRAAAGAIATAIMQRGTILHQRGGRTDVYSDVITEEVEELKQKLAINIVETINWNLKNGRTSNN